MNARSLAWLTFAAIAPLALLGCDEATDPDAGVDAGPGVDAAMDDGGPPVDAGPDPLVVPDEYAFESRFEAGTSSVSHSGQTARHVLIADLNDYVGGLTDEVDSGFSPAADGDVTSRLEYFFSLPAADRSSDPIRLTTDPATAQMTYGDLSGGAFLLEKLAGNDTVTDHRDWSTEFAGWSDTTLAAHGGGVDTPTHFVRAIFETLEENAIVRATDPATRQSPVTTPMPLPIHVTESGVDLKQLLQKFLLGAVAFSQAADDYTDDDVAGKGLMADNVEDDGGYTGLEHAWDEAFGYFGAAANYGDYTAESLAAGPVFMDADENGAVDLFTEYNFGASVNAAKRDNGAAAASPTDFMGEAWTGFRTGRAIITHAGGELSTEQMTMLTEQRDAAIGGWERAIAATVVHYINDTLQVMADFDTADYDHARFLDHAKVWSEMKGFALMFQFNPRSPLSATDFVEFHQLVGDAPVLPAAGATAASEYRTALRDARALLGAAYGFEAANLGDDDGLNGW